ncbi:hypothetical protein [Streptomyces cremeus]|uniref:Uncharacterized protein n=1 Tax=Streptomyces cremeus TaxID=66881 RepID=A0ABV5PE32_STRCM
MPSPPHPSRRPRPTGTALAALVVAGLALSGTAGGVARAADLPDPAEMSAAPAAPDMDTDTSTDMDAGTDPETETDAETDTGLGMGTDTGLGTDTGTEADTSTDPDAGTGPDTPTDPLPALDPSAAPGALTEGRAPSGKLEFHPATASPGTVVTVNTTACGPGRPGTGDASSLGVGDFTMTTGTHREVLVGQFTVPSDTAKGAYAVTVSCTDGKRSATGELWVTAGTAPSPNHTAPTGHVRTGVGGTAAADPGSPRIAAGAAVLVASAVGGTWLLRRRASGSH